MAIEVLLRRSIEGVGDVGEVVRVRARLRPQLPAALRRSRRSSPPRACATIEKDKAAEAVREAEPAKERAALAEQLATVEVHDRGARGRGRPPLRLRRPAPDRRRAQAPGLPLRGAPGPLRAPSAQLGEYEVPIHLAREPRREGQACWSSSTPRTRKARGRGPAATEAPWPPAAAARGAPLRARLRRRAAAAPAKDAKRAREGRGRSAAEPAAEGRRRRPSGKSGEKPPREAGREAEQGREAAEKPAKKRKGETKADGEGREAAGRGVRGRAEEAEGQGRGEGLGPRGADAARRSAPGRPYPRRPERASGPSPSVPP